MIEKRYLRSIRLLSGACSCLRKALHVAYARNGDYRLSIRHHRHTWQYTGMTCKELGEKLWITKGTLTGVLDRLEAKGLVQRERKIEDKCGSN